MTTPFVRPPSSGTYNDHTLELIDQRIRAAQQNMTAVGTVADVDPLELKVSVRTDDSTVNVPARLAGHVQCWPGDRVTLVRHGAGWVVSGNLTRIGGPNVSGCSQAGAVGSPTSSFADMPGSPGFTFVKRWTNAGMLLFAGISNYVSAVGTDLEVALKFTGLAGSTTYSVWSIVWSTTGTRMAFPNARMVAGGLVADTYAVTIQWKATGGTVNGTVDDWVSAYALELGM